MLDTYIDIYPFLVHGYKFVNLLSTAKYVKWSDEYGRVTLENQIPAFA